MPFAQNVLSQMDQCIQKKCIYGDPALALTRVRTRVNPRIEPNLQRYVTRGIRATIQIDEKGNVTVSQIANANPRIAEAIKAALEQWKFNPMVIDNQARCVETDLPLILSSPSADTNNVSAMCLYSRALKCPLEKRMRLVGFGLPSTDVTGCSRLCGANEDLL